MGFFSWDCKRCNKSIKAPFHDGSRADESDCVAVVGTDIIKGMYDGYGRVGSFELIDGPEPAMWHRKCWEEAGRPTRADSPSLPAADQGFFCD